MTLILSTRCRDGCAALADRRSRKVTNGVTVFEDDWDKLHIVGGAIVFNHGYNQIRGSRWYAHKLNLSADPTNKIYSEISSEMTRKHHKKSFYVFLIRDRAYEIAIEAGLPPRLDDLTNEPFLVSGDGRRYVNFELLREVQNLNCQDAISLFQEVFKDAYKRQQSCGDDQFSEEFYPLTTSG